MAVSLISIIEPSVSKVATMSDVEAGLMAMLPEVVVCKVKAAAVALIVVAAAEVSDRVPDVIVEIVKSPEVAETLEAPTPSIENVEVLSIVIAPDESMSKVEVSMSKATSAVVPILTADDPSILIVVASISIAWLAPAAISRSPPAGPVIEAAPLASTQVISPL